MTAIAANAFLGDRRFHLFEELGAIAVSEILQEAEDDILRMQSEAVWGNRFGRAIKLLAAHRLTMILNAQVGIAIAGSISNLNVSNGSQSVGFGGGSASTEDPEALATTVYGREFALLQKQLPLAGFVI